MGCLNIKICKCVVLNSTNMSNFHPLEVVDRGSETQLQVGENLSYLIQRFKGQRAKTNSRRQARAYPARWQQAIIRNRKLIVKDVFINSERAALSAFLSLFGMIESCVHPLNPHGGIILHLWRMAPFQHLRVLERTFSWNCFNNNILFYFFTHYKSSLSTTSREFRQQFAACSGWRWQW